MELSTIIKCLRNQLRPDVYQDERHKWRDEEIPGGSGQF
uniref:Uncharacterized protein n=1 Tax=Heterorhabditis bacteriophora TaxID=37862 RepID=A0A1I7WZC1_HETBA